MRQITRAGPGPSPPSNFGAPSETSAEILAYPRGSYPEDACRPTLAGLEADTRIIWTELRPDLSPWFKLGLAYVPWGDPPNIALRLSEDPHAMPAEIIACAEQMLELAESIVAVCRVVPMSPGARGEASHRDAG